MPFHPFKAMKKILPRSLFGRALLILLTPLICVQLSLGYFFFDRHTDTILRLLANNIIGDVKTVAYMLEHGHSMDEMKTLASRSLSLDISLEKKTPTEPRGLKKQKWLYLFLGKALDDHGVKDYYVWMNKDFIYIRLPLKNDILVAQINRKKLYSRTTPIVLLWTALSALLLFIVASIFMRNQIRPLRRLSEIAEHFGKGQDVEKNYRPEGAREVRQVGLAFNLMRERILRHIQERTAMLAGVSHDLRTPLTRMKLQLSMMPESSDVDDLKGDVDQMQKMVEGFLTFARYAEQGNHTVLQTTNAPIKDSLEAFIRPFQTSSLNIHLVCSSQIKARFKWDLIERCFLNLLSNAERYASEAWITVRRRGHFIEIIIDDNGPGIPEEEREEVFRPFYRLDASRNTETGGVGLGLSIVRDIIHQHGGNIRLNRSPSEHGEGLRVIIRLPE